MIFEQAPMFPDGEIAGRVMVAGVLMEQARFGQEDATVRSIYERIYGQLEHLGIVALVEAKVESAVSKATAFMDLHYDRLREGAGVDVALAHYFEQNGDLCCDPDMEIRLFPEMRMAEALTFQQAIPPVYDQVYPEPGMVNLRAKRELNGFLTHWLKNAIEQGHSFGLVAAQAAVDEHQAACRLV